MPSENTDFDDLRFHEQRRDIRIVASVPGRYSLGRLTSHGARREYPCRAISISARAIALAAPVIGRPGELVLAEFDHFAKLQGTVGRLFDRGFVMNIIASEDERADLAAKIAWFELYKNHDVSNERGHERFIPANSHSSLLFSNGTTLDCVLLDLSAGGAAISAEIVPEIGSVMAIGKVVGRVVRLFAGGFALKFLITQDKDQVERLVTGL